MKYDNITSGTFLERPNRFIAYVEIDGKREKVHVKNTGRCRELLTAGATVFLEKSGKEGRSTAYDLIAVQKGNRLINMDSQAPNRVVEEWLYQKSLFPDLVLLRPETTYGKSRFDFYLETSSDKIFMEVKGVTLEQEDIVSFPDAPSERAVKHVEELIQAVEKGYQAYLLFVIQMKDVRFFRPNWQTQPEFAKSLERAAAAGVKILAYDCEVTKDELRIGTQVPVCLSYLSEMPEPLLDWYDRNRRILPWREEPQPYRVWVSEIMLQQTRVEAVKPYFERFMQKLPDIPSLACAQEKELLKLWEGLGYYNRVRNLQAAAVQIMEEYQGRMPEEYEELLKLKGIGSYTAGAVASIAYGRAVPAVDGNVLRVVSRLIREEGEITGTDVKQRMWEQLMQVIPKDRPGDFNQAMMEIGATVCIPNGMPHCTECPLQFMCQAYQQDCVSDYPKKAAKKGRKTEKKTMLLIQDENKVVLKKRPAKGLLSGMYEFPALEGYQSSEQVLSYLKEMGLKTVRIMELNEAKHIFSHIEWHMKGFLIKVDELEPKGEQLKKEGWLFVDTVEAGEQYPIPSALTAYAKHLDLKIGSQKVRENWRKKDETVIDSNSLL